MNTLHPQRRMAAVALLAILILCGGAVTLRRIVLQRADYASLATRPLQPGELVYLVNDDGTITLRIGDGETVYGRAPADPTAMRVAARRTLSPITDYYVETFGGAVANADASYTIGSAAIAATGGVRVVAIDPLVYLSDVDFDVGTIDADPLNPYSAVSASTSPSDLLGVQTNSVAITFTAGGSAYARLSNFVVRAWADRLPIGSTNDATHTTVYVADAIEASSPTSLGQMQRWLALNEGQHWSYYPAVRDVLIGARNLVFGTIRDWAIFHDAASDDLIVADNGFTVARFRGESYTGTNTASIVSVSLASEVMNLYVTAIEPPLYAPEVAGVSDLVNDVWRPVGTITNTWPATVEVSVGGTPTQCYWMSIPATNTTFLYKVFCEFSATNRACLDVRSLRIDGVEVYLHTNGVVMWR